jgi:arylsulfatase A-like enzyme
MKPILTWLAIIGALLTTALAATKERPPNIVFILTDDLGIKDLGVYGSDYHRTPRLDRLAAEGLRFSNAYAASSVCSPTRASILTGQYPHRLHLTDALPWDRLPENPRLVPPNHLKELPASDATYAKSLREAGYRTALFGKWHLGNEHEFFSGGRHRDYGFDEAFDADYRKINNVDKGVDTLTEQALGFIESNRDRPFMLALHHHTPHVPLAVPAEYQSRYDNVPPGQNQQDKQYAGMISHLDDAVGRLLDKLDKLDLTDNTIVIFTSDNGGFSGKTSNMPYREGKATLYEGGIRVPLLVRWPGQIKPGSVCEGVTVSTDLFPTFLETAGLPLQPDAHLDGQSLVPWLRGEKPDPTRTVYWHVPHYRHKGPQSAVRDGDWKLIHNIETDTHELYDLANDSGEANDLAAAQPERTKELAAKLESHLTETKAQRLRPNPDWDAKKPRGRVWEMGVFYPKQGGAFQQVKDRDYPAWFQHAEPARPP